MTVLTLREQADAGGKDEADTSKRAELGTRVNHSLGQRRKRTPGAELAEAVGLTWLAGRQGGQAEAREVGVEAVVAEAVVYPPEAPSLFMLVQATHFTVITVTHAPGEGKSAPGTSKRTTNRALIDGVG
ncbi:hypothetical protein E2C01_028041 [Portunus trituberculatus]|uniref:Uncharacterized protein n=1 Tax=Portunus trituberculatus TaxID=210409 RepID=A0A5B7EMK3_PORTR|nr:hypothetical protein [Portunus trituberculatus]